MASGSDLADCCTPHRQTRYQNHAQNRQLELGDDYAVEGKKAAEMSAAHAN